MKLLTRGATSELSSVREQVKELAQHRDSLLAENKAFTEELHELRALIRKHPCPPDASANLRTMFQRLQTLIADTHFHIHLENNLLFPQAIELERGAVT